MPVNSVALYVAVRAGSRYESNQTTGTAHFLEHMLFEGTKNFPTAMKIAGYIEKTGVASGAWTDKEYVSYYVKVTKKHLKQAFVYLSEILFNPTLRDEAIQKEKGIIFEEIKRKVDNPEIDIWDYWFEWVWGKNQPLGFSTLGNKKIIDTIKREQLLNYLRNFYHPENMAIGVVGDFSVVDAENYATEYFGRIKGRKNHYFQNARFIPKKVHTKIIKAPTQQAQLMLGFVTGVSYGHKDRFTLKLIADLLGTGTNSRIVHELIYKSGIAYSSWVQNLTYSDTGMFILYGGFSPHNIVDAIKTILKELKKIKEERVSKEELMETKEKAKANILFFLETPEALANWYVSQQITEKKVISLEKFQEQIDKVNTEDIIRVAREYFSPKNICLTIKGPIDENVESIEALIRILR